MTLLYSFEKSGNYLFRNRGQIPVLLFILVIPVLYFTDYTFINNFWSCVLTWLSIAFSIVGFLIRAIAIGTTPKGTSGRNTGEQVADSLNQKGIYSVVRHPLYLGNYLMWIGIVLFTFNGYFAIIVSLAFWLYYERIMFAEERFLERKFGDKYVLWSQKVPAFLPKLKLYRKGEIPFSLKSVLRREYSGVLATTFGFAYVDHLRFIVTHGYFDPWRTSTFILLITLIITLALRTLKHHTTLLDEQDRS